MPVLQGINQISILLLLQYYFILLQCLKLHGLMFFYNSSYLWEGLCKKQRQASEGRRDEGDTVTPLFALVCLSKEALLVLSGSESAATWVVPAWAALQRLPRVGFIHLHLYPSPSPFFLFLLLLLVRRLWLSVSVLVLPSHLMCSAGLNLIYCFAWTIVCFLCNRLSLLLSPILSRSLSIFLGSAAVCPLKCHNNVAVASFYCQIFCTYFALI